MPVWICYEKDEQMIQQCQKLIQNRVLCLGPYDNLKNIEFLQGVDIYRLKLARCSNIIPKFKSDTLRELRIEDCNLKTIDDLPLAQLQVLELITNISGSTEEPKLNLQNITKCKLLKYLYLKNYRNIDLTPVENLTSLIKIKLESCSIKKLDVLAPLVNLEELILSNNYGINISALSTFQKLRTLIIYFCAIEDKQINIFDSINLNPIKTLKKLQFLSLVGNNIQYITTLQSMTQLKELILSYNPVIDISPLRHMVTLESLYLDNCNIKNLDVLYSGGPSKCFFELGRRMKFII
ncbi:Serine/threonine_protein [Hexamita inflata]|uniref:Serine/threonine protein n=1 Tax=Hexamita inflata TaxID=28002 RepID=A0AA86TY84_9EUKA|nr:Serine/threonine protein [Hexamita inflata]